MIHGPAIAVVFVLRDLLLALAIGRIGNWVIYAAGRHLLGIRRFDVLRRVDHFVILTITLVGVVRPGSQEKQCAADPHFLGIRRKAAHSHAIRWRYHHIARALWTIPVAIGVEIILSAIGHA